MYSSAWAQRLAWRPISLELHHHRVALFVNGQDVEEGAQGRGHLPPDNQQPLALEHALRTRGQPVFEDLLLVGDLEIPGRVLDRIPGLIDCEIAPCSRLLLALGRQGFAPVTASLPSCRTSDAVDLLGSNIRLRATAVVQHDNGDTPVLASRTRLPSVGENGAIVSGRIGAVRGARRRRRLRTPRHSERSAPASSSRCCELPGRRGCPHVSASWSLPA